MTALANSSLKLIHSESFPPTTENKAVFLFLCLIFCWNKLNISEFLLFINNLSESESNKGWEVVKMVSKLILVWKLLLKFLFGFDDIKLMLLNIGLLANRIRNSIKEEKLSKNYRQELI
jgi:hypothetical protein